MTDNAPKPRRRLALIILAGVSAAALIVWLSFNLYGYTPPQPLWTAEDLPPVPAEHDNGWVLVTAEPLELELPEELRALDERTPEAAWAHARSHAELLDEFLAGPAASEASETLDLARRRPAFADVCPLDLGARCHPLAWFKLHQLGELRSLDLALAGDLAGASELVAELIEMDRRHLEAPRSAISLLVGLGNLSAALHLADLLALQLGQGEEPEPETEAALAELAAAGGAAELDDDFLVSVVRSEYLVLVNALEAVVGGDSSLADSSLAEKAELGGLPSWLYSPSLTLREVNERFERRHSGAEQGDIALSFGAGETSPKAHTGWWLRNPVGKLILHALIFDPEVLAAPVDERLGEIAEARARFLARPAVAAR